MPEALISFPSFMGFRTQWVRNTHNQTILRSKPSVSQQHPAEEAEGVELPPDDANAVGLHHEHLDRDPGIVPGREQGRRKRMNGKYHRSVVGGPPHPHQTCHLSPWMAFEQESQNSRQIPVRHNPWFITSPCGCPPSLEIGLRNVPAAAVDGADLRGEGQMQSLAADCSTCAQATAHRQDGECIHDIGSREWTEASVDHALLQRRTVSTPSSISAVEMQSDGSTKGLPAGN